jgi:hypothetical protein
MKRHPYLLLAAVFVAWVIGAALMLGGCATMTPAENVEAALRAAGVSRDFYCSLPPETRAEFRAEFHLPHLIECDGDP